MTTRQVFIQAYLHSLIFALLAMGAIGLLAYLPLEQPSRHSLILAPDSALASLLLGLLLLGAARARRRLALVAAALLLALGAYSLLHNLLAGGAEQGQSLLGGFLHMRSALALVLGLLALAVLGGAMGLAGKLFGRGLGLAVIALGGLALLVTWWPALEFARLGFEPESASLATLFGLSAGVAVLLLPQLPENPERLLDRPTLATGALGALLSCLGWYLLSLQNGDQSALPASLGAYLPTLVMLFGLGLSCCLMISQRLGRLAIERATRLCQHNRELEASLQRQASLQALNQRIMQYSMDVLCSIDAAGCFTQLSASAEAVLGYRPEELIGRPYLDLVLAEDRERTRAEASAIMAGQGSPGFRNRYRRKDGSTVYLLWSVGWSAADQRLFAVAHDITRLVHAEAYAEDQRDILSLISTDRPLAEILNAICRMTEAQSPGALCSVLLLDQDQRHLRLGAAPSLPAAYRQALDGLAVGPAAASCGSAVFSQQMVIVEDIGQSPLWPELRAQALSQGLRACWSIPLLSHRREVLGSFAIYQPRALAPDDEQLQLLGIAGQLAAIAIKRQHNRLRLQESEQRYRSLFTFNPDPVFSLNLDGAYESLNRAGCELSGYREEELLGQSFAALLLPEDIPRVSAHFHAARAGESQHFEVQARTRAGQILELDVTNLPIMVDERIVGVFGIAKDISERNRMTRALREANQAMRERDQFFTLSLEMFCMLGLQGDFIQVNTAFLDVLGYPLECLIGHPYLELIHPEDRPQMVEEVRRLLAGEALRDLEVRVLDVRGQQHWLQLNAALGDDQLIYCAARDISERKAAEQVLRATLAELERSNRELQEFAFVASHDLQEPLRKIQSFAERLEARASELDEESRDYLQRMSSAAGRMQSLIRDLLAYSRVTTRAQPFQRLDLERLLDEVLQDMETALDGSGARIEREPLPQVLGDPTQMRQLLQNLLSNAIKFHREGQPPRVRIYAEQKAPGEWTLCVADRGIGFDEKYLDRIFNPFQRLHGHQAYPGTGIGLAIVKKIVERHGAQITASSHPGQGTLFRITFKSLG